MTHSLIVDDRRFIAEAYRSLLVDVGHDVTVQTDPTAVTAASLREDPPDMAFVDLSFPDHELNGLDVLLALHDEVPQARAVILTQADAPFQELLRCAWDALPLAGAISKDLLPADFARAVRALEAGEVVVDPLIKLYLPARRRTERTLDAYGRLMAHAGHAELWVALATAEDPPDYATLAAQLGKKHNTIKNYRDDLATYLMAFGMDTGTSLVDLHRFARTCRPLLLRAAAPHVRGRVAGGAR
ncbi:response regulator [Euzebya sp.]|uniref:response regulator n=1 Tax=Euzebya sp. TaxID=1971409 RepID=UPI003517079E